jgi:phage baseplate assembly protein W
MAIITPLSRRKEIYSDVYKTMAVSAVNADLLKLSDEQSVKESIKNLIMTNRGERLFQPDVGCDIRNLLFENFTPDRLIIAKELIRTTLKNYESRAGVIGIDVISGIDNNDISITITFNIINREEPIVLTLTLDRVR